MAPPSPLPTIHRVPPHPSFKKSQPGDSLSNAANAESPTAAAILTGTFRLQSALESRGYYRNAPQGLPGVREGISGEEILKAISDILGTVPIRDFMLSLRYFSPTKGNENNSNAFCYDFNFLK
ncbi:hypothetical protein J6590_038814 [Homalodisca vitripennis]|nr:hypothetical protein J6590_038814 [Homalodisca vitripennis]